MEVLMILTVGSLNIACFFIGVKAGKNEKNEAVSISKINPVEMYKQRTKQRVVEKEREKNAIISANIENYNGTSEGQQDV